MNTHSHSTGVSLVKSTPYAMEEVWKVIQATVTRLYQSEDKSLKEILRRERMFKSRIVRWGLDKKLKEPEVLHMLELNRKRQATGKDSRFSIEDQDVDWDRPLSSSPPSLDTDIQADVLLVFSTYHTSAFQTGTWVLDDVHLCEHDFIHVVQILTEIGKVPGFLARNQIPTGLRTLRRTLGAFRHVLLIREPRFYDSMLVNILTLQGDLPQEIRLETLRSVFAVICLQFEAEDTAVFKSEHALDVLIMRCFLLGLLGNVDGDEFGAIIRGYTAAATEALKQDNYELSCRILLGVATALLDAGDVEQAETLYQIGSTIKVQSRLAARGTRTSNGKQQQHEMGQLLETQQVDRCSTSSLCSRVIRYGEGASETKIIYGYYKGLWEPWSRWCPAIVKRVLDSHRRAREPNVWAAWLWADDLLSVR
ncbi:hypothetical protein CSAL01_12833 [Colletotrichum salicis]|uniref:Clr5 domain-containing protein n=1 Tax=Colletotrichum salicis TaxID=1209931 RepID=A0A135V0D1_9PEZI|nr:hypothetical protein CSAL01_12833 [Colletotrichum salicis]